MQVCGTRRTATLRPCSSEKVRAVFVRDRRERERLSAASGTLGIIQFEMTDDPLLLAIAKGEDITGQVGHIDAMRVALR